MGIYNLKEAVDQTVEDFDEIKYQIEHNGVPVGNAPTADYAEKIGDIPTFIAPRGYIEGVATERMVKNNLVTVDEEHPFLKLNPVLNQGIFNNEYTKFMGGAWTHYYNYDIIPRNDWVMDFDKYNVYPYYITFKHTYYFQSSWGGWNTGSVNWTELGKGFGPGIWTQNENEGPSDSNQATTQELCVRRIKMQGETLVDGNTDTIRLNKLIRPVCMSSMFGINGKSYAFLVYFNASFIDMEHADYVDTSELYVSMIDLSANTVELEDIPFGPEDIRPLDRRNKGTSFGTTMQLMIDYDGNPEHIDFLFFYRNIYSNYDITTDTSYTSGQEGTTDSTDYRVYYVRYKLYDKTFDYNLVFEHKDKDLRLDVYHDKVIMNKDYFVFGGYVTSGYYGYNATDVNDRGKAALIRYYEKLNLSTKDIPNAYVAYGYERATMFAIKRNNFTDADFKAFELTENILSTSTTYRDAYSSIGEKPSSLWYALYSIWTITDKNEFIFVDKDNYSYSLTNASIDSFKKSVFNFYTRHINLDTIFNDTAQRFNNLPYNLYFVDTHLLHDWACNVNNINNTFVYPDLTVLKRNHKHNAATLTNKGIPFGNLPYNIFYDVIPIDATNYNYTLKFCWFTQSDDRAFDYSMTTMLTDNTFNVISYCLLTVTSKTDSTDVKYYLALIRITVDLNTFEFKNNGYDSTVVQVDKLPYFSTSYADATGFSQCMKRRYIKNGVLHLGYYNNDLGEYSLFTFNNAYPISLVHDISKVQHIGIANMNALMGDSVSARIWTEMEAATPIDELEPEEEGSE